MRIGGYRLVCGSQTGTCLFYGSNTLVSKYIVSHELLAKWAVSMNECGIILHQSNGQGRAHWGDVTQRAPVCWKRIDLLESTVYWHALLQCLSVGAAVIVPSMAFSSNSFALLSPRQFSISFPVFPNSRAVLCTGVARLLPLAPLERFMHPSLASWKTPLPSWFPASSLPPSSEGLTRLRCCCLYPLPFSRTVPWPAWHHAPMASLIHKQ